MQLRSNSAIAEHLPLIVFVIIYMFTGYLLDRYIVSGMLKIEGLYSYLLSFTITFSAVFIVIQFFRKQLLEYINFRTLFGTVMIIGLLSPFASTFSSIKQVIPQMNYFSWDTHLMKADYYLHLGNHPWSLLAPLLNSDAAVRFLDTAYMLWFPVLFSFCLWMAWSRRRLLRFRFFICTSIVWMIFGSLLGTVFSSAGPCYFSKVTDYGHDPYQPMISALWKIHESEFLWAIFNQTGLWDAHVNHQWLPFGGISAMPSIHVAMAIIFALVALQVNRWFGLAMAVYAVMIFIGSIVLGWHYAVDGYVSAVLVLLLWKLSDFYMKKYDIRNIIN